MKRLMITRTTTLLIIFLMVNATTIATATYGQNQRDIEPSLLKQRAVFPKPTKAVINNSEDAKLLVLKFAEGTHIRVRNGVLTVLVENITPAEEELLKRAQITKEQIQSQINSINELLSKYKIPFNRMFTRDEGKIDYEKLEGELNSGEELADLNLYFYLFPPGDVATSELILNKLLEFSIVETAYAQPPAQSAEADISPTTSDFTAQQGYLDESSDINPASNGIDARYAWSRGADGQGVRIVDVEGGWNAEHEDLPSFFVAGGDPTNELSWKNHGTAVLGELIGARNGYGVTGIAPAAEVGVSSMFRHFISRYEDSAGAINDASARLRAGDIMLIELQRRGPRSGESCPDNCDQFEMIALEYWQADFDAIRTATARGIIVVEAAGNGSMNLDASRYENRFNRSLRDSGAIMVGAGDSMTRAPHVWSSHGVRVDVQGWGDSVMTLGYGGMLVPGADPTDQRQWYTRSFNGTSSAAPIVVGAAALIQSARRSRGLPILNSTEMRNLLLRTGTLQPPATNPIGPLPDLRAAFQETGMGSTRPTAMQLIRIREGDLAVDSGLEIQNGDRVVVEAAGEIWSGEYIEGAYGIWFQAPNNGPNGWFTARAGMSFPLPGATPYSLIGRFNTGGYYHIGRRHEHRYTGPTARLQLRINDNMPGNGSGEFYCLIQIYR